MNNNCNIECHTTVLKDKLCFDNTPAARTCIISDHVPVCIEKDGIKMVSFNIGKKSDINRKRFILDQCSDNIIINFFNRYLLLYNIICLQETDKLLINSLQLKYNSIYRIFHNNDQSLCILVDNNLQIENIYICDINDRIFELSFIYNNKNYIIYNCKYYVNSNKDRYMNNHNITITLLSRIYYYFYNYTTVNTENVLCILGDFNDNKLYDIIETFNYEDLIVLLFKTLYNYQLNGDFYTYLEILFNNIYRYELPNYMNYIYIFLQIFSKTDISYSRRINKGKRYYNDYIFIIDNNNTVNNISNIIYDNIYRHLFKDIKKLVVKRSTNEGSTDEGSTNEGNTDEGSTDEGNIDEGSTDEGNIDEGNTDVGNIDVGNTDKDFTDEGNIDVGNIDVGNTDVGNIDVGNTDVENTDKKPDEKKEKLIKKTMGNDEIIIIKNIIILLCDLDKYLEIQKFFENSDYNSSLDKYNTPYNKADKIIKYIEIYNKYVTTTKKKINMIFNSLSINKNINDCQKIINNNDIKQLNITDLYLLLKSNIETINIDIQTIFDAPNIILYTLNILEILPLKNIQNDVQIDLNKLTDDFDNTMNDNNNIKLSDIYIVINILKTLGEKYYGDEGGNKFKGRILTTFNDIIKKRDSLKKKIDEYIKNIEKLQSDTLSSSKSKYLKYKYKYINLINKILYNKKYE